MTKNRIRHGVRLVDCFIGYPTQDDDYKYTSGVASIEREGTGEAAVVIEPIEEQWASVVLPVDELIAICELAQDELKHKGFALVRQEDEQEKLLVVHSAADPANENLHQGRC